jgi:ribosomal protein S17E
MEKKKRQATYTISVPMQITFVADNDLTPGEFEKVSTKEVLKRLANGYFDVFPEQYDIKKKIVHYTTEEKRISDLIFGSLFKHVRGLR